MIYIKLASAFQKCEIIKYKGNIFVYPGKHLQHRLLISASMHN